MNIQAVAFAKQLDAWPDFLPAIAALRQRLPAVSMTMLPTALVVDVPRRNGITWDAIVSCAMIGVCKPHAQADQTTARWLKLPPKAIVMVACHNFDPDAAQDADRRTAFFRRPDEWGPAGPPDRHPNRALDFVADGFLGLQQRVLAMT